MRTYIKAYMNLNFGQFLPLTTELAALECLKNRCHHVISVDIDPIFFKLSDNKDMHNIMNEFEFRPDRTVEFELFEMRFDLGTLDSSERVALWATCSRI